MLTRVAFVALTFAAAVELPAAAFACDDAAAAQVHWLTVEEVASRAQQGAVVWVDVSAAKARTTYGIIPGARMVAEPSYKALLAQLPRSKSAEIVIYCADAVCQEARFAAVAAVKAGYTNVAALAGGVRAWFEAGHPVAAPQAATDRS